MIRRVRELVIVAAVACGGRTPPPAEPTSPDPEQIAARLDRDMTQLGDIAARHRDDCPALIGALRPLIARMKLHVEEAGKLQGDRELGSALQEAARKYDAAAGGRTDAIAANLAAAYLACKRADCSQAQAADACRSARAEELRRVIDQIPTW